MRHCRHRQEPTRAGWGEFAALLEEAIKNALTEAGLTNKDVDGVVVRGPDDVYSHHQLVAARLGIDASFSTSLDNGGASQILSIILAVMAIEAGLATTVVCGYGRDSWSRTHAKDGGGLAQNDLIPAAQRPKEHGPEFGHFGAVSQHAFGARVATCSNMAPRAMILPRSPWRSANMRWVTPKPS